MYIRNICKESDFYPALKPTPMLIDNSSAIAISKGPGVTTRTGHIELRYHYVRQLVRTHRTALPLCASACVKGRDRTY
jgi:hypothetical protein